MLIEISSPHNASNNEGIRENDLFNSDREIKPNPNEPATCNCKFEFYTYFFPSEVDLCLLPFAKHAANRMENEERQDDINDSLGFPKEVRQDRRIRSVEVKSMCCIKMSNLGDKFIKGLPRRKITVSGCSYDQIARALTILQDTVPDLMKNAIFPKPLQSTTSSWSVPGKFVVRPIISTKSSGRAPQCATKVMPWENRILKSRIFPNGKYFK